MQLPPIIPGMPTAPRSGSGLIPLLVGAAGTALTGDDSFATGFSQGLGDHQARERLKFGNELALFKMRQEAANRAADNQWRQSEAERLQGNVDRNYNRQLSVDKSDQEHRDRTFNLSKAADARAQAAASAATTQKAEELTRIQALEQQLIDKGMPPALAAATARSDTLLKAELTRQQKAEKAAAIKASLIKSGVPPARAEAIAGDEAAVRDYYKNLSDLEGAGNTLTESQRGQAAIGANSLNDARKALYEYTKLFREHGSEWGGKVAGQYKSLAMAIVPGLQALLNSGTLNEGEQKTFAKLLGELDSPGSWMTFDDTVLGTLEQLEKTLSDKQKQLELAAAGKKGERFEPPKEKWQPKNQQKVPAPANDAALRAFMGGRAPPSVPPAAAPSVSAAAAPSVPAAATAVRIPLITPRAKLPFGMAGG